MIQYDSVNSVSVLFSGFQIETHRNIVREAIETPPEGSAAGTRGTATTVTAATAATAATSAGTATTGAAPATSNGASATTTTISSTAASATAFADLGGEVYRMMSNCLGIWHHYESFGVGYDDMMI